jgi:hypothetical protein
MLKNQHHLKQTLIGCMDGPRTAGYPSDSGDRGPSAALGEPGSGSSCSRGVSAGWIRLLPEEERCRGGAATMRAVLAPAIEGSGDARRAQLGLLPPGRRLQWGCWSRRGVGRLGGSDMYHDCFAVCSCFSPHGLPNQEQGTGVILGPGGSSLCGGTIWRLASPTRIIGRLSGPLIAGSGRGCWTAAMVCNGKQPITADSLTHSSQVHETRIGRLGGPVLAGVRQGSLDHSGGPGMSWRPASHG